MIGQRQLTTEFYLINSNASWLKKNFQFIQAIFAGTSWVHMRYCIVQSPNIYHVLCPRKIPDVLGFNGFRDNIRREA